MARFLAPNEPNDPFSLVKDWYETHQFNTLNHTVSLDFFSFVGGSRLKTDQG